MKYFIRSLKYFVALCVLCAAIMALNRLSGFATLTLEETFYVMFHTTRGMMLPAVIVLLAAFYPKFGFVQRKVEGDVGENREQIVNAFKSAGFSLRTDEDGVMTFRADSLLRKLTLLRRRRDKSFTVRTVDTDRRHTPRRGQSRIQAGFVHTNDKT